MWERNTHCFLCISQPTTQVCARTLNQTSNLLLAQHSVSWATLFLLLRVGLWRNCVRLCLVAYWKNSPKLFHFYRSTSFHYGFSRQEGGLYFPPRDPGLSFVLVLANGMLPSTVQAEGHKALELWGLISLAVLGTLWPIYVEAETSLPENKQHVAHLTWYSGW